MQKFYVDQNGAYLGGLDCSALPEELQADWLATELAKWPGAVEVPSAPDHALAIWNGQGWDEPEIAPEQSVSDKIAALEAALIDKGVIAKGDLDAIAVGLK